MKFRYLYSALILSFVYLGTANGQAIAPAALPLDTINPIKLYGPEMRFDIMRSGSKIGDHRVTFDISEGNIAVSNTSQMKIDFLFITAFQFLYDSKAKWRDGHLHDLKVRVDDDGAKFSMTTRQKGSRLIISDEKNAQEVDHPIFPTNHWHSGVLKQNKVLNTLTGKINDVQIRPEAYENVTTESGQISAMKYIYSGDLNNEVWYDDEGRWVKMRFKGRDGSVIEYICRQCQGGMTRQATQ